MSIKRGFTLTEMLAVIGIMLILMVTTFGVFTTFAQRAGPDTAVSTIQAMLNGARDYAASNGVVTAVYFSVDSVDPAKPKMGSTMKLCYKPVGSTTWIDVRGRSVITLSENMYACRDLPSKITAPLGVGDARSETDVTNWKKQYEENLIGPNGDITKHVTGGASQVDAINRGNFYVVFDPAGYLSLGDSGTDKYARDGLTIVQLFQVTTGGGTRVAAFALYPFNSLSGTRLIFDF
jgi:prepilin-type N-terminal cleavage/methylation domain-containing protein